MGAKNIRLVSDSQFIRDQLQKYQTALKELPAEELLKVYANPFDFFWDLKLSNKDTSNAKSMVEYLNSSSDETLKLDKDFIRLEFELKSVQTLDKSPNQNNSNATLSVSFDIPKTERSIEFKQRSLYSRLCAKHLYIGVFRQIDTNAIRFVSAIDRDYDELESTLFSVKYECLVLLTASNQSEFKRIKPFFNNDLYPNNLANTTHSELETERILKDFMKFLVNSPQNKYGILNGGLEIKSWFESNPTKVKKFLYDPTQPITEFGWVIKVFNPIMLRYLPENCDYKALLKKILLETNHQKAIELNKKSISSRLDWFRSTVSFLYQELADKIKLEDFPNLTLDGTYYFISGNSIKRTKNIDRVRITKYNWYYFAIVYEMCELFVPYSNFEQLDDDISHIFMQYREAPNKVQNLLQIGHFFQIDGDTITRRIKLDQSNINFVHYVVNILKITDTEQLEQIYKRYLCG